MTQPSPTPEYSAYKIKRSKRLQPLRRAIEYRLAQAVLLLTGWLSVPGLQRLGRFMGWAGYHMAGKQRAIADYQLRMALPEVSDAERPAFIKRNFAHMGMTICEALGQRRIRAQESRWVHMRGEEVLLRAHARGKGVMLITAHTGNWELIPIAMERLKLQTVVVVRGMPNPRINKLMRGLRQGPYLSLAERGDPASARQMLGGLKKGHLLVMATDSDIDAQGVFVDFFGIPAFTPRGPASLVLKTGAALVTGFDERREDGSHLFHFEEIEVEAATRGAKDPELALTKALTQATERFVREHPRQWSWNHRRWKRRPTDEQPADKQPQDAL